METCNICNKEFSMYNIQRHIRGSHKLSTLEIKKYYDKYYKKEGEGVCPFSNKETEFKGIKLGYKKYLNTPDVRKKALASNSIEFQMKVNNLSLVAAADKIDASNAKMVKGVKQTFNKNLEKDPDYLKAMSRYCKEFWIKRGHSEEESITFAWNEGEYNRNKFKEKLNTEGNEWFKKRNQCCIEYWLDQGYSKKEAALKLKDRQLTFSKEICIEKYGDAEGLKRWNDRQEKWLNSYKFSNFSKISQDLFWKIYEKLSNDYKEDKSIFFATLDKSKMLDISGRNHELRLKLSNKLILPDFIILENKKIIEFDGSYWHNNKMQNTQSNKGRALERDNLIVESGYEVLHISESNYYSNPDKEINKCINFIYAK